MARDRMDLTSFVGKLLKEDDSDILRDGIRSLAQMIMDVEVSSKIGAAPYERSETRTAYRNGYRTRAWDTRVGTVELKSPRSPPAPTSRACWTRESAPRRRCRP
jgi:putative transposase